MGVAFLKTLIFFFAAENDSDTSECEKIHKPLGFPPGFLLSRRLEAQEADKIKKQS